MEKKSSLLLAAMVITASTPVYAHHSFATHYNMDDIIELTGTVTEVSLRNPHSFFMLDVSNDEGDAERWEIEAHAIPIMRRLGIDSDTVRLGDTITIRGPSPRRDDKNVTFGGEIILTDGSHFMLLDSLRENLNRNIVQEDVTEPVVGSIVERMAGRWGLVSGAVGQEVGVSPLPLNGAGFSARAEYDPRDTPAMRCIPPNLPSLLYVPYLYEIRTDGGNPVLFHEYHSVPREIELNAESVISIPPEFGRRRARIESGTLIVESDGFPAHVAGLASDFDQNGNGANVPSSQRKQLVERYSVSEDGQSLVLDLTVRDPVYLSEPFNDRIEWRRLKADAPIYEFECDVDVATRSTLNAADVNSRD